MHRSSGNLGICGFRNEGSARGGGCSKGLLIRPQRSKQLSRSGCTLCLVRGLHSTLIPEIEGWTFTPGCCVVQKFVTPTAAKLYTEWIWSVNIKWNSCYRQFPYLLKQISGACLHSSALTGNAFLRHSIHASIYCSQFLRVLYFNLYIAKEKIHQIKKERES